MASSRHTLTYVTGNKMKLEETKSILRNFPFQLVSQKIDLPEYQGEPDFIIKEKCKAAIKIVGGPVMVEDTCLCFKSLSDLPGPYIKWFLEKMNTSGLYKLLDGFEDKSAYSLSIFALSPGNPEDIIIFKGICDGKIVNPKTISTSSWDSCFTPNGFNVSFHEMEKSTKNKISHRGNALKSLEEYFKNEENLKCFLGKIPL